MIRAVRAASSVVVAALGVGLTACSGASNPATTPSHAAPAASYPLASDGWKPGQPALLALTRGQLSIRKGESGVCAWLSVGTRPRSFLWPSGYRATLSPPALVAPNGHVVGRAGDWMSTGGGFGVSHARGTCGHGDSWGAAGTVSLIPTGTVTGTDAVCSGGFTNYPPHAPAVVRVLLGRVVVDSTRLTAGEPMGDEYRFSVPPGRYRVTASNWPHDPHAVAVKVGTATTVDFLNLCG